MLLHRQRGYLMPGVLLYVCLSVSNFTWNYWTHLRESFTTDLTVDKKELIKFESNPHLDPHPEIILRISTLPDKAFFPQLGSYLRKNWSDFHENFTAGVFLDKKVPAKFRKSSGCGVSILIRTQDSEVCALRMLLLCYHTSDVSFSITSLQYLMCTVVLL